MKPRFSNCRQTLGPKYSLTETNSKLDSGKDSNQSPSEPVPIQSLISAFAAILRIPFPSISVLSSPIPVPSSAFPLRASTATLLASLLINHNTYISRPSLPGIASEEERQFLSGEGLWTQFSPGAYKSISGGKSNRRGGSELGRGGWAVFFFFSNGSTSCL
ncbi:unnamed protein product [Linum trigynum]|uniref:Uncharacterized protein n=1 Tax=Linum trigynum TaxID=586398 RepID=A0AAV2CRN7_9ROSI